MKNMKIIYILFILGIVSCKKNDIKKNTYGDLAPKINNIVDYLQKIQVFEAKDSLGISRKSYEIMTLQLGGKKEAVRYIEEFNIPQGHDQIPIRIYNPEKKKSPKSSAIVYIHGGWFVSGGYETHDAIVRKLANETGSIILFVDYRLAPEHPFPAGLNDCITVTQWLLNHAETLGIDHRQIGIIGDSAGGALAVSVATQFATQLKFQILIYPAVDATLSSKSWGTYKDGPILNKQAGVQAWKWYLSSQQDYQNPLAVPILIKNFKHKIPTLVLLAEHDPLRDEGIDLSKHMIRSGVPVKISFYNNMVHGFMHMGGVLEETQRANNEIADFIDQTTTTNN